MEKNGLLSNHPMFPGRRVGNATPRALAVNTFAAMGYSRNGPGLAMKATPPLLSRGERKHPMKKGDFPCCLCQGVRVLGAGCMTVSTRTRRCAQADSLFGRPDLTFSEAWCHLGEFHRAVSTWQRAGATWPQARHETRQRPSGAHAARSADGAVRAISNDDVDACGTASESTPASTTTALSESIPAENIVRSLRLHAPGGRPRPESVPSRANSLSHRNGGVSWRLM